MAILKCHECGEAVSTEAASCTKCGAPPRHQQTQSSGGMHGIVFVLIFVAFIGGLMAFVLHKPAENTLFKPSSAAPSASKVQPRSNAPIVSTKPDPQEAKREEASNLAKRNDFAKKTEEFFLDGGYNVAAKASGTTLKIEYALASPVFMRFLQKADGYRSLAGEIGFRKIVVHGVDTTYTMDL